MIRVHLLCERLEGELRSSSFVRMLLPFKHPSNAPYLQVTTSRAYQTADVVIVERTWEQDFVAAQQLVHCARRDGVCLVFSIDDDLLVLAESGPLRKEFMTTERVRVVRLLARESHGVIVSTDPLKQRMLFYNNRVITVPNAIDECLFDGAAANGDSLSGPGRPLKMGYMGTATHDACLLLVAEALRASLEKYRGSLEFELIGGIEDPNTLKAFEGLPFRVLRSGDALEYPAFVRWMKETVRWDFAIAPLGENAFTRCKSDIKFLDYSALGVPAIYSRVPPYERSVCHQETGYLAENRPAAWQEAIDFFVSQPDARAEIARRARRHVLTMRTLNQNAAQWRGALEAILAARRGGAPHARTNHSNGHLRNRLLERILQTVSKKIPLDSTVLIASRANETPFDLGRREVWHLPREGCVLWTSRSADAESNIAGLEYLRQQGAQFLVVPATSRWWLDRHPELKQHLEKHHRLITDEYWCLIFALGTHSANSI